MIWQRIRRVFQRDEPPAEQQPFVDMPTGDASREAYQRAFRLHTPATWDLVELSQGDLLGMLVDRVPAEVGVGAILGVSVLFGNDPLGATRSRALLATVLDDLPPAHSRLMLLALADAWRSAERQPYDARADAIRAEVQRSLRRLAATGLSETERVTLGQIEALTQGKDSVLSDER
jgi:hypothetical protein